MDKSFLRPNPKGTLRQHSASKSPWLHIYDPWSIWVRLSTLIDQVWILDVYHYWMGLHVSGEAPHPRIGFVRATQLTLRLVEDGLLHAGPPCNTFVWVSRGSTGRSKTCPEGNQDAPSVATGNLTLVTISISMTSSFISDMVMTVVILAWWFVLLPFAVDWSTLFITHVYSEFWLEFCWHDTACSEDSFPDVPSTHHMLCPMCLLLCGTTSFLRDETLPTSTGHCWRVGWPRSWRD